MKTIVALAGDGIGPEIMASGLEILKTISAINQLEFTIEDKVFGGAAIDETGQALPADTLAACEKADAILLGAIGGPKWQTGSETPEKGLLALRKSLNLFANIRPITILDELVKFSPIKEEIVKGTDFVVVRELTGGIYFGEPRKLSPEEALDTNVYTRKEIERIIRQAFELAKTRRKKVTSVDKANVLATSKLWRSIAEEIAAEYPEVTFENQLVDSVAMKIIQMPTAFDVIVTENLFGDILSDESSVLAGSIGVLPSASHSDNGPSLYEPIHGSAPDIAGKNLANPLSMIYSITMMLKQSFGYFASAEKIEQACDQVIAAGIYTPDLGGKYGTKEFTQEVINTLQSTEVR
ncbi:3-isopropylmalate dehydrogenase [Enterococcus sp. LJL120]